MSDLVRAGHLVVVTAPNDDVSAELAYSIEQLGVNFRPLHFSRSGIASFSDIVYLFSLLRLVLTFRPDCVFSYTLKPVLYSGLLLRFCRFVRLFMQVKYIPLITGLGYLFSQGQSSRPKELLRYFVIRFYSISLKAARIVVFQNPDDLVEFKNLRILPAHVDAVRVYGSGVDLNLFPPRTLPDRPIFLMMARLISEKGVREYVAAAKIVREQVPDAVFRLAGMFESGPNAISQDELRGWTSLGIIEYLGNLVAVQDALAACRFYILPSYYREGTPRSVLEAMATARPIITADTPGCRETVRDGVNGFLVPPMDANALASAMLQLIDQSEADVQAMAAASLNMARSLFDVRSVNAQLLRLIES